MTVLVQMTAVPLLKQGSAVVCIKFYAPDISFYLQKIGIQNIQT